jgi:hypothetical protein
MHSAPGRAKKKLLNPTGSRSFVYLVSGSELYFWLV